MSLSDRQWKFTRDADMLTRYIEINFPNVKAPRREVQRTAYQQEQYLFKKLTATRNSKHLESLAEDRAFYVDGVWVGDWLEDDAKDFLQPIGDFWESLGEGYRWGGNFKINGGWDLGHFEAA